jgi:microcystin-dependent protein
VGQALALVLADQDGSVGACGLDFWGSTAPNSSFAFPAGQAISRTTYATLFSIMSTTYGSGDGSTTFNLPDKTGRITAMKEASATRLTSTYFGGNSASLGAVGGLESQTLGSTQIPGHTHSGNTGNESNTHTHSTTVAGVLNGGTSQIGSGGSFFGPTSENYASGTESANHTHAFTTDNGTGGGLAHNNVQPTIICNYIIRII